MLPRRLSSNRRDACNSFAHAKCRGNDRGNTHTHTHTHTLTIHCCAISMQASILRMMAVGMMGSRRMAELFADAHEAAERNAFDMQEWRWRKQKGKYCQGSGNNRCQYVVTCACVVVVFCACARLFAFVRACALCLRRLLSKCASLGSTTQTQSLQRWQASLHYHAPPQRTGQRIGYTPKLCGNNRRGRLQL